MAAERGWQRKFDDSIPLPDGRMLVTLRDAASYITALPKTESALAVWRPDAIDQDGLEAVSLGLARRAATPIPQPGRWLSTPRHGATGRSLGKSSYPLVSERFRATAGRSVDKSAGESVAAGRPSGLAMLR
jgi:hypothetical protein